MAAMTAEEREEMMKTRQKNSLHKIGNGVAALSPFKKKKQDNKYPKNTASLFKIEGSV